MKHLVRAKQKKPDLPEVFRASEAQIPEKTLTRDMFKEAQERFKNAKAGGGMLVQPGFGGVRQGYREEARFKQEGLKTRVSDKIRNLIEKKQPINPKTGKVYTMKEYASLTRGQKDKLSSRLRDKFKSKVRSPRLGYYPEKDANKLINFLKIAADKQKNNNVPLKERTFISVFDKGKFVGVRDVRANTLYTHIDYKGKRKGTSIALHPSQDEVLSFLKEAKKFKFEKPDRLLGSYFSKYERVPTYSEIYNFFNRDRNAPIKSFKQNALEIHHRNLIEKMPDAKFQLVTMRKNTEANRILNALNNKQITKKEADAALKKLGVNLQGMGKKDITTGKSIASAKRETVKLFKDALKENPNIADDIAKKLQIKEQFLKNLENKKFNKVADVIVKASREGGFGEVIQTICKRKTKKEGGRVPFSTGSGCPAADQDPKGFLKSVSDNPQLAKFFKSAPGQKAATAAARVTGNILNPSTLVGGEVAFVLGDGLNNFASGLPLDESFDRAFVFGDFGKFEENLINQAKELGYDDNQLNLLQQTINLNKLDNRKRKLQYGLEVGKQDPSALTSDATMGFENRLVNVNKNLDDSITNYFTTLDKMGFDIDKATDQETGFRYLDNVFKKRTQDQLIKTFDKRKRQVDPTQTPVGDFLSPFFDLGTYTQPLKFAADVINPFTKDVPFLSERQRKAIELGRASEEELDKINRERGFTLENIQQGTAPQIRPLMDYLGTDVTGQGFGSQFLAGGGIAKLAGVDSGPPPASGPNSQGLQGLMKRVKRM